MHLRAFLILLLIVVANNSFAQQNDKTATSAPDFVLVQLPTYYKKVAQLEKAGKADMVAQLKTDAASISKRMVMDFNDNFSYCPVYYFADSNTDKILQYKMEGNVLDTTLAPATLPASKNYLILVLANPIFPLHLRKKELIIIIQTSSSL